LGASCCWELPLQVVREHQRGVRCLRWHCQSCCLPAPAGWVRHSLQVCWLAQQVPAAWVLQEPLLLVPLSHVLQELLMPGAAVALP
jgi:hypothetical protein